VLPRRCAVEIQLDRWPVPPLFRLLQRLGKLPTEEMLSTFNMGIGMVLFVPPRHTAGVERLLQRRRTTFFHIGEVVRGRPQVHYQGRWQ
jgi:phosphoribosylformylglycinamidine cyclo-ligase